MGSALACFSIPWTFGVLPLSDSLGQASVARNNPHRDDISIGKDEWIHYVDVY